MNEIEARELLYSKFSNIRFEEEGHKYYVEEDGECSEYKSVSSIIQKYEIPFDTEKQALNYSIKHNIPKDEVIKNWKYTNLCSTITGSRVHLYGEGMTWLKAGITERIPIECMRQYVPEYNWLIPTSKKEESVKKFYDELDKRIIPVGAEFKMSSQYVKDCSLKICGTSDILFYYDNPSDKSKSGFIIGDWKTNKDLFSEMKRKYNTRMLPPFDDMIDENFSHYTIQFNLYQLMMESIGINVIGRRLIWIKEDGYEVFKIDDIRDKIKKIIK